MLENPWPLTLHRANQQPGCPHITGNIQIGFDKFSTLRSIARYEFSWIDISMHGAHEGYAIQGGYRYE